MYPELFKIPFTGLTVWSYGFMMVVGFIAAITIIKRLSRNINPDPQFITNAALYALITGVVGARIFYVLHYFENFKDDLLSIFAIWKGGLELLGGVILALTVIILYLRHFKLPVRRYLDILAIGLFFALALGRIGCFLNGCCFGKPTDLPWAVRFPYGSFAYRSQVQPDPARDRLEPHLELPPEYFEQVEIDGFWYTELKSFDALTANQQQLVKTGPYRCLPVHPTQLYSSANAALCGLILFFLWRRSQKLRQSDQGEGRKIPFTKPGYIFSLMFVLYGLTRFCIEILRDDSPFEFDGLTVSQNLGIAMIIIGLVLFGIFFKAGPDNITLKASK